MEEKARIIQELVPGKQVTIAHLIAHPDEDLAKKMGVPGAEAVGILTLSPREAAMIAGDLNCAVECNALHGPRLAEIIQKLEAGEEVEKIQYVDESVFPADTAAEFIDGRAY